MLMYPKDLRRPERNQDGTEGSGSADTSDYVRFRHREWRANRSVGGDNNWELADNEASPPTSTDDDIILYMPNSTPQASYGQNWQQQSFAGPLGGLKRGLAQTLGQAINDVTDVGSVEDIKNSARNFGRNAGELTGTALNNAMPAVKQLGMEAVGQMLVGNGNNLLSLTTGKVYNPNVELLYQSPSLRSFSFNFDFVPKNAEESEVVDEIIKTFKVWSAPRDDGGFLCVPHVWDIYYGGIGGAKMNRFKPCAMTNITVQDNAGSNFHTTFVDGTPTLTSIQMQFQEVDILLSKDHTEGGVRGF